MLAPLAWWWLRRGAARARRDRPRAPRRRRSLRIGHRGAAALAPENTLRAFRAAVAHGVDLIEFDVLDLPRGPLVLAHSDRLDEVSHGAAAGTVRDRSLAELREVAPELPTLDEALAFFVDEAPEVGLHVDLKLDDAARRARRRAAAASGSSGARSSRPSTRRACGRSRGTRPTCGSASRTRRTATASRDGRLLGPVARAGLVGAAGVPRPPVCPRLVRRAGATALMLQHALVTPRAVARARALGAPVLAWTVDEPDDLERVVAAGVAGVITNDPRIFAAIRT